MVNHRRALYRVPMRVAFVIALMLASACTSQAPWLDLRIDSLELGPEAGVGVIHLSVFATNTRGEPGEGVVTLLHEGTVREALFTQGRARFEVGCVLSGESCAERVTLVARWQGLEARLERRVSRGVSDGTVSGTDGVPARPRDDSPTQDAGSCGTPVFAGGALCAWSCSCDYSCQTSDGGPLAVLFPTFAAGPISCSEGELCFSTHGVPARYPGLPEQCCQVRRHTGVWSEFGGCTVSGLRPGLYAVTLWTTSAACSEPQSTSLNGIGVPREVPAATVRILMQCPQ
jgi:hypothetical protein